MFYTGLHKRKRRIEDFSKGMGGPYCNNFGEFSIYETNGRKCGGAPGLRPGSALLNGSMQIQSVYASDGSNNWMMTAHYWPRYGLRRAARS